MKNKIGVFDSGIGGLTVLEELKKSLPHESFIYYADSKNNPYGEKNEEELYKIVKNVVEYLLAQDVKLIVIACNTATTRCMKRLRKDYKNVIFVGTVPAIKVACDKNFKNTLVMATPATINSKRTSQLINDNKKPEQKITLISCDGLAHAIEIKNKDLIMEKLATLFKDFLTDEIDSIVLGCTHYPLIKKEINSFFPKATLIDGAKGVAKEVKKQLTLNNLLNDELNQKQEIIYYNSNDKE